MKRIIYPIYRSILGQVFRESGVRLARFHKTDKCYEWINGHTTFFGTAEIPESLDGPTLTWAHLDETEIYPDPMAVFRIIIARLRQTSWPPERIQRYRSLVATTTPNGPTGIVGHFADKVRAGDHRYATVVQKSTEAVGLPDDYTDNIAGAVSEDLYREKVLGEIIERKGAVYAKQFKMSQYTGAGRPQSGNLIEWQYNPDLPTYVGIDWGTWRPAVQWYQHDEDGIFLPPDTGVIFAEWTPDNIQLPDMMRYLLHMHNDLKIRIDAFCVDPGGDSSQDGRIALRKTFGQYRIPIWKPRKRYERNILWGIQVVQSRLSTMKGNRRLLFSTTNLWGKPPSTDDIKCGYALDPVISIDADGTHRGVLCANSGGYQWQEYIRKGIVTTRPHKDTIWEHSADCERYLMLCVHPHENTDHFAYIPRARSYSYADAA